MTNWNYYSYKPAYAAEHQGTERGGYLFAEDGEREIFDGAKRTASEWESYLEANDIRGTVR